MKQGWMLVDLQKDRLRPTTMKLYGLNQEETNKYDAK